MLPLICAKENVLTESSGYRGYEGLSKSLAGRAFLFRRHRGQPSGLVRARSPTPFLSAVAAIFQVGARVALSSCAPHTLRVESRPQRLRVRVVGRLSGGHWPGRCGYGASIRGGRTWLSLGCRASASPQTRACGVELDSVWVLTIPGCVQTWNWLGRGGCPPGQPGNDVMGTPFSGCMKHLAICRFWP